MAATEPAPALTATHLLLTAADSRYTRAPTTNKVRLLAPPHTELVDVDGRSRNWRNSVSLGQQTSPPTWSPQALRQARGGLSIELFKQAVVAAGAALERSQVPRLGDATGFDPSEGEQADSGSRATGGDWTH